MSEELMDGYGDEYGNDVCGTNQPGFDSTSSEPESSQTTEAQAEETVTEQQQEAQAEPTQDEAQDEAPPEKIVRTNLGVFTLAHSPAWGKFLAPCPDPDAKTIDKELLEKIILNKDFPKVPAHLWSPIIRLYFYFCDSSNKTVDEKTEVSVLFLRKEDDLTQWRVVVPTQEVGAASVDAKFEKCCDIVTGEELVGFPPAGWIHAGSSHSHQTMGAFFSGVDDKNELSVPGLHVVVGKIHDGGKNLDKEGKPTRSHYELKASIVLRHRRLTVDHDDVIDLTPMPLPFHKNVLKYVSKKSYSTTPYSYHHGFGFAGRFRETAGSSSSQGSSQATSSLKSRGTWGDWEYPGFYDPHDEENMGNFRRSGKRGPNSKAGDPKSTLVNWEKLDKRSQLKLKLLKDLLEDLSFREETYEAVFDLLAEYVG